MGTGRFLSMAGASAASMSPPALSALAAVAVVALMYSRAAAGRRNRQINRLKLSNKSVQRPRRTWRRLEVKGTPWLNPCLKRRAPARGWAA
jgi:hypothetical protein